MSDEVIRHWYLSGCKTREQAEEKLEDLFATGEVSEGEKPEVKSYKSNVGRRWGIVVNG